MKSSGDIEFLIKQYFSEREILKVIEHKKRKLEENIKEFLSQGIDKNETKDINEKIQKLLNEKKRIILNSNLDMEYAINMLNTEEKKILIYIYKLKKSENWIAKKLMYSRTTVHNKKTRILEKINVSMEEFEKRKRNIEA